MDQLRRSRWDHANIGAYYTRLKGWRSKFEPLNTFVEGVECSVEQLAKDELIAIIDAVYSDVVSILANSAGSCVPVASRKFYNFWWNEDLSNN